MLGSQTLEVVIGLIFIFLLLSLLATAINELIMSFFSFRGKDLEKAIKIMLDDRAATTPGGESPNPERAVTGDKFYALPLIRKFAQRGKDDRPSYLSRTNFSRALLILLSDGGGNKDHISLDDVRKTIDAMPDGDTKRILLAYLKDAGDSLARFRAYLETWYDEMMDRASGWYKRRVQYWLVGIGFVLALVFNADPFLIARKLSADPEARKNLVAMADAYHKQLVYTKDGTSLRRMLNPAGDARLDTLLGKYGKSAEDSLLVASLYANQQQIATLVHEDLAAAGTVLGMGWGKGNGLPDGLKGIDQLAWVLVKLLGLLITAMAVSLGAPFWFDMLNKVMNIRGTGVKPGEKTVPVPEPVPAPESGESRIRSLRNPPPQTAEDTPAYG